MVSPALVRGLAQWFSQHARLMPWRTDPTPYRVWISEIMLQQTQVVTVIPYFERFMKRFPTVLKLARAPEEEVLRLWSGLGYYSRARNLHKAARQIVETGMPLTRAQWLELPGVGAYTAGAVCSIALNLPEAILDANVERVLSRVYRVGLGKKGVGDFKRKLWARSQEWVAAGVAAGVSPRDLNQALMELGALVCLPRGPRCGECPLRGGCLAFGADVLERFPPSLKRAKPVEVSETVHLFLCDGKVLVQKRMEGQWRAGLWDLPLKIDSWVKKLKPRLVGEVSTQHIVTHHRITRVTRVWKLGRVGVRARTPAGFAWVAPARPELATGAAFAKCVRKALAG
ncbi:A/G-specific adenine glycosylase [Bdellovibrionota bacterium FG-1]